LPRDGSWLVKPTASAGGQGIRPLGSDPLEASRRCYYQERIAGPSVSALFLGLRDRAELLGVTRQWVGRPGAEFAYVGSVAPWPISRPILSRLEAIGEVLTRAFALTGLFGIDAILSDGVPWPVEVNPRYTAAVEVLELALGRSLLAEHRRAYDPGAPATNNSGGPSARAVLDRLAHGKRGQAPGLRNSLRDSTAHGAGSQSPFSSAVRNAKDNRSSRFVAKRIVFASTSCRFPDSYAWEPLGRDRFAFAVPTIADVPHPGTPFEPGDPVLTLFATGTSLEACQRQLQRRQTWWERRLRGTEDSRFEIPDSR
jgi:predicted ATP-grasp superfamily ATP-dependent carboligase